MKNDGGGPLLGHGPLRQLEENLWMVDGELPGMALRRTMVVARLPDGRLVVHNGILMDEDGMRALGVLGRPAILVVPNGWHRIDAHRYKERYPELRVLCPRGAAARVTQVVPVDGHYDDPALPEDGPVRLEHVDGLREREGVMVVRSAAGTTLVFNDLVFNQPHLPGFSGFVMRALGSTGSARVTGVARFALVAARRETAAHLRRLAEAPSLRRVIPGHGLPIEERAAEVLRTVADGLSR
jgi:hypothetical protein